MSQKIQQLTTCLVTELKSKDKDGKEKTLKEAFKQVPKETKKAMSDAAIRKGQRLATIELLQEQMQTLIDSKSWASDIRAVFPDAEFRIFPCNRQIIIEV